MTRSASRLLPALFLVSIGACDSDPSGIGLPEVLVRTDKQVYSKAADGPIVPTFINQSSGPVYILMGEYVYIEQASDNGWLYHGPWFVVDGFGSSFALAAGDSLVDPLDLDYFGRAGTYRLVYQVAFDPGMQRLLPKDVRVSEPFRVDW